jgi:hypothetical protein
VNRACACADFSFLSIIFKGWRGWFPTARIERPLPAIEYFPNLSISSSRRGGTDVRRSSAIASWGWQKLNQESRRRHAAGEAAF